MATLGPLGRAALSALLRLRLLFSAVVGHESLRRGRQPPEWICEDLRHEEPAPGGALGLRPVGIPCGFRPLADPFSLFLEPAIAAPLFLPAVPAFGLPLWAVWIAVRDPWGGGPKIVLDRPCRSGGEVGG